MEYRILGSLDVVRSGSSVPLSPRHRRLLAVLLLTPDEVVPADRLVDVLWGECPPDAANALLQVRISELRKALGHIRPERDAGIVTRAGGYSLRLGGDVLDARRFEALARSGREALQNGTSVLARERIGEALGEWRGRPFGELADELFAQAEVARLEELHLQALEDYWEAELSLGHSGIAAAELGRLVAEHQLRERLWGELMLAEYRCGRQAEALQTYSRVREVLVDRLGVEPGRELQELQEAILRQDVPLLGAGAREPAHNLPIRLSSFVGRGAELATVREGLRRARLVTIVGAGGVGKSSLALAAGADAIGRYRDGTWLVELSAIISPGLVAHTVADAVGIREQPERSLLDVLVDEMRSAQLLLILDNCEHVISEVAELARHLLQFCERLSVLATSTERLGVAGELVTPLAGLRVPATDDVVQVAAADASRLLVERARSVQPELALDDTNAAAVAQICRRLDGLPLAIELAAARASALELAQIASRLDDRFRLLTDGGRTARPRHRTLRAVIDWSHSLLPPADTKLFHAVAVFIGGFTLEAAEDVCVAVSGPEDSVAELLAGLVDRSLVVSEASPSGRRYRLLETLRAYSLERLREHGGEEEMRRRHAAYYLSFAEPAGIALRGPEQPLWLLRLETEHGNLRAALSWFLERGPIENAARLAVSLYPFWDLHGHYREGRRWIEQVLTAGASDLHPALRARVLMGDGTLAVLQGDLAAAADACKEAAVLSEQAGDPDGLAHAQQYLAFGALVTGDDPSAQALLDQCLRNAHLAGNTWLAAWAHLFQATAALSQADWDRAVRLAAEGQTVLGPAGDPECAAWLALLSGAALWYRGDLHEAIAPLRTALEGFRQLGGLWGLSVALLMAGSVSGGYDRLGSTTLLAASERLRVSVGVAMLPVLAEFLGEATSAARAALGPDAFARAWAEGDVLSVEAAAEMAALALADAASRTAR